MSLPSTIRHTWRKVILGSYTARQLAPTLSHRALVTSWAREAKRLGNTASLELAPDIHFVWVPKAAGTSVAKWLRKGVGLTDLPSIRHIARLTPTQAQAVTALTLGHQSSDSLIELGLLNPESLNQAYSFAFVRNPYHRAVSLWRYLVRLGKYPQSHDFSRFVRDLAHEHPTVGPYNLHGLSMAAPMVSWVKPTQWSGPSDVFAVESVDDAITQLQKKLSIPESLRNFNSAESKPHTLELSKRALTTLQEFYAEDFEAFNYSEAPPAELFEIR